MSEDQIRTILSAIGVLNVGIARIEEALLHIKADNVRGETVHADHEQRIRALEVAKGEVDGVGLESRVRALEVSEGEGRGMWKLLTAGGLIGAMVVAGGAGVLKVLGG